jgi:hypothetical protein
MARKQSIYYDSTDLDIYQTDGYSGSHTDVDNTERFTDDIDLTVNKGAVIDFTFDGDNATDDLTIKIYKRRDSSWTGNEIAWKSALTVSNDGSEDLYTYTIPPDYGAGHYRFGLASAGATTTFEIDCSVRTWRDTDSIA